MNKLNATIAAAACCAALGAQAQSDEVRDHPCAKEITKHVNFRDPDSVRVTGISAGKSEVIDYADTRLVAVKFTVMVNSKGAQGGYTGERPYQCFTSEDRRRVLEYKPKRD